MLEPDIRERLKVSAAEYDRIAEIAGRAGDVTTSASARQSASDIRRVILAAEDDVPPNRPSYAQVLATAVQYERLLILLILQAGGELRLAPDSTVEFGEGVIRQRYRVNHTLDPVNGDFVLTAAKTSRMD